MLTTITAVSPALPPSELHCLLGVFWHRDIRTGRMWVHDVIHRRQKYAEYHRRGQKNTKSESDVVSAFLKGEITY